MKYKELFVLLENEKISTSPLDNEYIEKFIDIADSFPAICFMSSPNGEIYYFNQKWYETTEATIYDSIGDRWQHFVHPIDIVNLKKTFVNSIQNKKQLEVEFRLLNKDRKYCWYKLAAMPQKDDQNRVLFFLGICMDINALILSLGSTQDKIQNLEFKNQELESITQEQGRFVDRACHDLKAPLHNIEGLVQMLKGTIEKNEEAQSLINMMDLSINSFKNLVSDIAKTNNKPKEELIFFLDIFNPVQDKIWA